MKKQEVLDMLGQVGAVMTNGHFVYASGKHGSAYVNKDDLYSHTLETSRLCRELAEQFARDNVEVVIAPAIGGVILSQWVAYHLTYYWLRARVDDPRFSHTPILGVYAEHEEKSVFKAESNTGIQIGEDAHLGFVDKGCELVIRKPSFVIKRGYDKIVAGKNVLVVEDILTTGGSAREVIRATRACGGNVVGLGALCNRGGVTPADVANPPKLFALVNVTLDAYDEVGCPLCAQGVPINTEVGKGKAFLARQKAGQTADVQAA